MEVIGVSMISPEGLAISPLIPASCLTWVWLPLAPESIIMYMGFELGPVTLAFLPVSTVSEEMFFIIAWATSSLVFAQMSITLLYLSPLVISPWEYWFSTFMTSCWAFSRRSFLDSGIIMSAMEIEAPDLVEYLNPRVLRLSASSTVLLPPDILKQLSTRASIALLVIGLFTSSKGTPSGTTSYIRTLPTVVSCSFPSILTVTLS